MMTDGMMKTLEEISLKEFKKKCIENYWKYNLS